MKLKIEVEGKQYTFEFDRKTIKKAEKDGLNLELLGAMPMNMTTKLWQWGLVKNHPSINEFETDKVYEGCLKENYNITKINEKLGEMYASFFQPTQTNSSEAKEPIFEE